MGAASCAGHAGGCPASCLPADVQTNVLFDAASLVFGWVRRLCSGRDALACYVRCALAPFAASPSPPRSLFPMAPPYSWVHGSPPRDAPARRAWQLRRAQELLTNLIVLSLSHLALRGARRCPPWARFGGPLSAEQSLAATFLRERVDEYLNPEAPVSDREFRSALLMADCARCGTLPLGTRCPPTAEGGPLKLDPSRAVFAKTDADFEPTEYLGTFAAACYIEPDLLSRKRLPGGLPAERLVASGPQRGLQGDILGYLRQWDAHRRLLLEPPSSTSRTQQGTLFPVPKSAEADRIVFNRIPRNIHETHLPGYARYTVGGHEFTEVVMGPRSVRRIFAEDLADCFPSFKASRARGVTNALAWTAPASAFAGTLALRELELNCLRRGIPVPTRVRPCYLGLPMGDLNAADFAAEAHTRVLREGGSYPAGRALVNGAPIPRTNAVEALVIDDHIGISIDEPGQQVQAKIWHDSFEAGARAYARVGLRAADRKSRRGVDGGVVLGAEFVAGSTFLGAERTRRRRLAEASLIIADRGRCSRHILRRVLGTWTHVMMYRRPFMCLFSSIFQFVGQPTDSDHVVVRLPHSVCRELKLSAVLAPVMVSNLAAAFTDRLVCSDASPFGEGAASAQVPVPVVRELWRHRERRGAYTRVFTHWAAQLRLAGLKEEAMEHQELEQQGLEADRFGSSPSPERILIETFDYLEICCGGRSPLVEAIKSKGLRTGPRIDLAAHSFWDISRPRVYEWLMFLAERRRVVHWHSGVPCVDFSVARHPVIRTHSAPWGFDPTDPARASANFMLSLVCVLIMILIRVGYGSFTHEHPASAHSWAIKFWDWFQRHPRAEIGRFCACRYGAPFKKDTRLARLRAEFLRPLDRMCQCVGPHAMQLTGGETKKAAKYLPAFCTAYAAATAAHVLAQPESPAMEEARALAEGTPARYEKLWVNDLLREVHWVACSSRLVGGDAHINVRETRAAIKHALQQAGRQRSVRVLEVLDSRVSIGALAKGRSASRLLNDELRAALPEVTARDLYLGFIFGPSRLNPGDAPSRMLPLPRSDGRGLPSWARSILKGEFRAFDDLSRLPDQSRASAGWACLVVRLTESHGIRLAPKELPFDSTLGYPGEGPRSSGAAASCRAAVDIRYHRVLTPAVAARRQVRLSEFLWWVCSLLDVPAEHVLQMGAAELDRALTEFGQLLWQGQRSLLDYCETINAIVDTDRGLRGHLPRAWEAAWVWRSLTPSTNRVPMPEKVLLAMMSVALAWNMPHVALLLAAGFMGLLRVHELRWLRFGSFMSPRRLLNDDSVMFIIIEKPKMRRMTARRSYVRIDDPAIIALADAVVEDRPDDSFLFNGSYQQLRAVFNAICAELRLPHGAPQGLTLGSLRPGGATWLYRGTDNTELVRFRGRWASNRMLEIYIQEVGAASMLPLLSVTTRARITALARHVPTQISNFIHGALTNL